jgi:hypothetical protein
MLPFIVKMTWSHHKNALSTEDFIFTWLCPVSLVVPALPREGGDKKFCIAVIALAAGVPSITDFQRELLFKQKIQSASSQKLLCEKRHSPKIYFNTIYLIFKVMLPCVFVSLDT